MSRSRPGYALLVSMLLVLALATLALGAVATGAREGVLAATLVRTERARALAEAAAMDAVRSWSTRRHRALPIGGAGSDPRGVAVERIGSSLYMLRATAAVPGGSAPVRAAAGVVVRTFDATPIEAQLPAAATAETDARLDVARVSAAAGCGTALGPGLVAPLASIGPAATLTGSPPHVPVPATGLPAPDAATDSAIFALADLRVPPSAVSPGPRLVSGRCSPAPDNWGSTDPGHPCHGLRPVIHAHGPLAVVGGEGRGVLLVEGSLTLSGATLHGVILVRGTLTLDAGARIRGAARAGRIALRDGTITGDPCEVADALAAPALDGPFRPAQRYWIPVF